MTKLLDAWDIKILSEIEFNYHKTHQEIAKKIRRSKAFVSYRIKKMEELDIISYQPLIDYSALGYTYYRVIIETLLDKEELVRYIKKSIKAVWLVEKYDKENFVIVIAAKSFGDFKNQWESIYEQISSTVLSKNISLAYTVYHLPLSFLNKKQRTEFYVTGASKINFVTETEKELLDLIIESPLMTKYSMAKRLDISINTLKKTLGNLETKKIILAYQTLINRSVLGIRHHKLFLSFDFSQQNKKEVLNLLMNNPNVIYITESSYDCDLECELYTFDDASFEKIIKQFKKSLFFRRIVISQMKSEVKLF